MKLINSRLEEIMGKKGCDASNMFDEEIPLSDQEHSDDDDEKAAKRMRKMKHQGKNLEDGELPTSTHDLKKKAGKPNKR